MKTGDSGLENKNILNLDESWLRDMGGQNTRPTTGGPPKPAGKPKVRDHGASKDSVFGWFATVGFDSPDPYESKPCMKEGVHRAISALYPSENGPDLTSLCSLGQQLGF